MRVYSGLLALLAAGALAGCHSTTTRVAEHQAEFNALPPAVRRSIGQGVVEPGFTATMVYMALGKPAEVTTTPTGESVWTYHEYPVTAYNETIQNGFRRRVVYDPVKRANDIVIEPVDEKAFPQMVPKTLRITLRQDRVVALERMPER